MDNSPMWDQILQRMHLRAEQIPGYKRADINTISAQDRPTSAAYDRFAYTWSSSLPIAATTKTGPGKTTPSWTRTCSSTRFCTGRATT